MMRAGPLVVMVAMVVITKTKTYNEQGQLSAETGGSNGYKNVAKKNMYNEIVLHVKHHDNMSI